MKTGTLVISLDFELMWGMFDKLPDSRYHANIRGVHAVVPKLLAQFTEHEIHATWATVGLLSYSNVGELQAAIDTIGITPNYRNTRLSAYEHLKTATITATPELYFAPELITHIANTPHQEIASHTFAHFYCREAQADMQTAFAADCEAQQRRFTELGHPLTSLVFPRNQWNSEAIAAAAAHGLLAVRGTEDHFLYRSRTEDAQTNLFIRGLRLLDHYVNLSGYHTYNLSDVQFPDSAVCNIPASRFLRPVHPTLTILEPLRARRIKRAMTHAATHGEIFHLWWHPHNFGVNPDAHLAFLDDLLAHFSLLRTQYGMQSRTMRELATQFSESDVPTTSAAESAAPSGSR